MKQRSPMTIKHQLKRLLIIFAITAGVVIIAPILFQLAAIAFIAVDMSNSCSALQKQASQITTKLDTLAKTDSTMTKSYATANCGSDTNTIDFNYTTTRQYTSAVAARENFIHELRDAGIPLPSSSVGYNTTINANIPTDNSKLTIESLMTCFTDSHGNYNKCDYGPSSTSSDLSANNDAVKGISFTGSYQIIGQ